MKVLIACEFSGVVRDAFIGGADLILKDREESFLLADGLEEAFIGIGYQFHTPIAIYSKSKAIQCLMDKGMDEEQAYEYFDYNVAGAYVGEQTPVFLEDDNCIPNKQ